MAATGRAVTPREVSSICHLLHDIAFCVPTAQLELGITCIQIQQLLHPDIIRSQIRSQVVLYRLLLLILLLRPCCYVLNVFPVSVPGMAPWFGPEPSQQELLCRAGALTEPSIPPAATSASCPLLLALGEPSDTDGNSRTDQRSV